MNLESLGFKEYIPPKGSRISSIPTVTILPRKVVNINSGSYVNFNLEQFNYLAVYYHKKNKWICLRFTNEQFENSSFGGMKKNLKIFKKKGRLGQFYCMQFSLITFCKLNNIEVNKPMTFKLIPHNRDKNIYIIDLNSPIDLKLKKE